MAEPTLRQDLEADMLSECAKLGAVDKVRVKTLTGFWQVLVQPNGMLVRV